MELQHVLTSIASFDVFDALIVAVVLFAVISAMRLSEPHAKGALQFAALIPGIALIIVGGAVGSVAWRTDFLRGLGLSLVAAAIAWFWRPWASLMQRGLGKVIPLYRSWRYDVAVVLSTAMGAFIIGITIMILAVHHR